MVQWLSLFDWRRAFDRGAARAGGREHVRSTVGRGRRRLRTGGRIYGRNGAQACARRRRQMASGKLKGVRMVEE